MQCRWDRAWIGRCLKEATDNGFCSEHQAKCAVCDEQATRECDFAGQFVCGVPICDKCEHQHGRYGYGF